MAPAVTQRAVQRAASGFIVVALTFAAPDPVLAQRSTNAGLTITLDADSTEARGRDGAITFRGIRIAQGDLSISADTANASGLDFSASNWTFEGDVRFASGTTVVTAGRADLSFENQQLVSAELSSPPVRFEQNLNGRMVLDSRDATLRFANRALISAQFNGAPVTYQQSGGELDTLAEARRIVIDQASGVINLNRDALIKEGTREIRGSEITYNYRERSVVAASNADERVTITIAPPDAPSPDANPGAGQDAGGDTARTDDSGPDDAPGPTGDPAP